MPRGRPKKKVEKKEEPKLEKEVKEGVPAIAEAKRGDVAATTSEMWAPKPDMGKVAPPPDKDDLCECGHTKEFHYGSQHNWCNTPNCRCGAWKRK